MHTPYPSTTATTLVWTSSVAPKQDLATHTGETGGAEGAGEGLHGEGGMRKGEAARVSHVWRELAGSRKGWSIKRVRRDWWGEAAEMG